jgi:hypothetical protein
MADFWHIPQPWETFAGGGWTGENVDLASAFHAMLTAGNRTKQPKDWRYWSSKAHERRKKDLIFEYNLIWTAAWGGRCLLSTKYGSIGLGHSDVTVGDTVCVLLGADVPFIL